MSLLLDALRRADRERQQGKPPSLSLMTGRIRDDRPAKLGLLVLVLLLGALGGAGIYLWSAGYVEIRPGNKAASPASAVAVTAQPQTLQTPPPELRGVDVVTLDDVLDVAPPPVVKPARSRTTSAGDAPQGKAASTAGDPRPAPDAAADAAPATEDEAQPVEPSPVQPSTREQPALRGLREMPPAYRADFPDLRIDVHVYLREQARRFVLVNGRRYKEGERLAEGPQLVAIVPNGIVLDYRGERVLYPVIR